MMAYKFDIKKWYWERYQIVQIKSHQYKYYGIDDISKYE